jgi:tetratricopeptide (TPR) repeat protein
MSGGIFTMMRWLVVALLCVISVSPRVASAARRSDLSPSAAKPPSSRAVNAAAIPSSPAVNAAAIPSSPRAASAATPSSPHVVGVAIASSLSPRAAGGEGRGEGGGAGSERAGAPGSRPASSDVVALQALKHLADEDVLAARDLLRPLEPFEQGEPAVKLAGGVLRFFEQRYPEAVALIEASGAGNAGGYLGLAKAAQGVTKNHARADGEHFVVSIPKGKDEVLVPYLVDTLERQRAALTKALGDPPPRKLTIELVNDVKELAALTTLKEAEIRTSGTVAVAKFGKLMLLSPKALAKGYDWLDTAAHEYTHHVVTFRSRNHAPIWLQEGLAKWFETHWRGAVDPVSPFSAALVRDAVAKNQLVTFKEMHPSLAKLPSQERAALAYAQVVMAIELLVGRAGPSSLAQLVDRVGRGEEVEKAVAATLGQTFGGFLQEWKRYMGGRALPRGGEHELKRLRFKDDPKQAGAWVEWQEIPDETARGHARLGEIFRERGRWAAARVEYGKAYARIGGRVPILSNQYALAARMSGAKDEAERVLGEALAWNPDYPALNVQLARLRLDAQDWGRARDLYLAANRQDPFDPEIHAGLAKAFEALGDPGAASRETRFAKLLLGRDAGAPAERAPAAPASAPAGHGARTPENHP